MQHRVLQSGRWAELSFPEQMANIGSETSRVYNGLSSGKESRAEGAFCRFQELMDLTIQYGRLHDGPEARSAMWKELCRFRELFCKAYLDKDLDKIASLNRYLDKFANIARRA